MAKVIFKISPSQTSRQNNAQACRSQPCFQCSVLVKYSQLIDKSPKWLAKSANKYPNRLMQASNGNTRAPL